MVQWLLSLPKTIFVTLVLTVGILFIVLSDPPHHVCDSQLEKFSEATKDFLKLDPARKTQKEIRFKKLLDVCKSTNTPGGCLELFMNVRQVLKDANAVSLECRKKLSSNVGFDAVIWQTMDVMVKIAWGEKPPMTTTLRINWFDPADLSLFCRLKRAADTVYGQERLSRFMEPYFQSLPGAKTLNRTEAWNKMLFAQDCAGYL